jgi:hypothetical protein
MRKKQILTIMLGGIIILAALTTKVQANLQSRPEVTSLVNKSAEEFFIMSRNMEQSNESFGLNATIDQSNGTETSASNNIDVHMAKNTEWGTAVMLGASNYGEIISRNNK